MDSLNGFFSSVDGVLFDKIQTTLIRYPGAKPGAYAIPNTVTTIGGNAFDGCIGLTSVTIPDSVTNLGDLAFYSCINLTNLSIGNSVTGIGQATFYHCVSLAKVTIPNSVTSIGDSAFFSCTSLTNVVIGSGVTSIDGYAFSCCFSLVGVYFLGNSPNPSSDVFDFCTNANVYCLPGTTGWGSTFGGLPTAPWLLPYPVILTTAPNFGIQNNAFGFRISWATNVSVVVEASTDIANSSWSPVGTNTLTGGWSYFKDAEWTNYPGRLYRIRSQ